MAFRVMVWYEYSNGAETINLITSKLMLHYCIWSCFRTLTLFPMEFHSNRFFKPWIMILVKSSQFWFQGFTDRIMCPALALVQASLKIIDYEHSWLEQFAVNLCDVHITPWELGKNFENFQIFGEQILNTKMGCDHLVKVNIVQVNNFSPLILYQQGSCPVV